MSIDVFDVIAEGRPHQKVSKPKSPESVPASTACRHQARCARLSERRVGGGGKVRFWQRVRYGGHTGRGVSEMFDWNSVHPRSSSGGTAARCCLKISKASRAKIGVICSMIGDDCTTHDAWKAERKGVHQPWLLERASSGTIVGWAMAAPVRRIQCSTSTNEKRCGSACTSLSLSHM